MIGEEKIRELKVKCVKDQTVKFLVGRLFHTSRMLLQYT